MAIDWYQIMGILILFMNFRLANSIRSRQRFESVICGKLFGLITLCQVEILYRTSADTSDFEIALKCVKSANSFNADSVFKIQQIQRVEKWHTGCFTILQNRTNGGYYKCLQ